MNKSLFVISLLSLFIWSCTPKVQTGGNQGDYYEDLSAYRPTYPAEDIDTVKTVKLPTETITVIPEHHITDTLNAVLDSISSLSQEMRYIDGYTVQIYSGNNREAANIASGKAYTLLETAEINLKPKVSYNAPNFKVQVGQFYSTLDAHTIHAQLLEDFPNAIIVLKKFRVKRS